MYGPTHDDKNWRVARLPGFAARPSILPRLLSSNKKQWIRHRISPLPVRVCQPTVYSVGITWGGFFLTCPRKVVSLLSLHLVRLVAQLRPIVAVDWVDCGQGAPSANLPFLVHVMD